MMERSIMTTWEVDEGIGVLTLSNPPQNYITEPGFVEINRLREWTSEPSLRGIIITGAGRHFSAGGDLSRIRELAARETSLLSEMEKGLCLLEHLDAIELPVIAAIRGACFGAGLEIALACHIRVCCENAIFAFPEINHGLVPGLGGASRIAAALGRSAALQILLSGDIIDAARALEVRLVDHLVPARAAMEFSVSLMKKMVAGRPLPAINSIVRAIKNARVMDPRGAMEEETRMFCRLAETADE